MAAGSPNCTSRAWVSAIFNAAIKWSGWTTFCQHGSGLKVLADLQGRSTSTPSIPARTFNASNCFCLRTARGSHLLDLGLLLCELRLNRFLADRESLPSRSFLVVSSSALPFEAL